MLPVSWIHRLDLIEYKCLCCNKNYQKMFDKKLKVNFFNAYSFANNDISQFILSLQKGVYPFEYMHDLEYFNEALLLLKKEIF